MRKTNWNWSKRLVIGVARGVAMGCADVVPGVSGGTIAVLLGIYERLLAVARDVTAAGRKMLRGDWHTSCQQLKAVDWWLLLPLLAGIGGTILLLASTIETQLMERPETVKGLFCGLIAASLVAALQLFNWQNSVRMVMISVSTIATFMLLGLQVDPVDEPSLLMTAGAAAVAICAMTLPGISGAFLLLIMGMYEATINIVSELRYADMAVFVFGAVVGLALFSSLLGWLLDRAHDTVMAVLVGLMLGSLRVLWPWSDSVDVISYHESEHLPGTNLQWPETEEWLSPTVAAVVSFTIVMILVHLVNRKTLE